MTLISKEDKGVYNSCRIAQFEEISCCRFFINSSSWKIQNKCVKMDYVSRRRHPACLLLVGRKSCWTGELDGQGGAGHGRVRITGAKAEVEGGRGSSCLAGPSWEGALG